MTRALLRQGARYVVAGLASNAALYGLFLLLLAAGLPYGAAMTVSYAAGVALAFQLHRNWTFERRDAGWKRATRFVAAYTMGYLINVLGLTLLVEGRIVGPAVGQAVMIVVVAIVLFILQRAWVFRPAAAVAEAEASAIPPRAL